MAYFCDFREFDKDKFIICVDYKFSTQMRIIEGKVVFINLENEDKNYIGKLRYCYNLIPLKIYKQQLEDRYLKDK